MWTFQSLHLYQIQPNSHFHWQWEEASSDLIQSLQEQGLLMPLIVIEDPADGFQLLDGFKRYAWLQQHSSPEKPIDCWVMSSETSMQQRLLWRLETWNAFTPLTGLEVGTLIQYFQQNDFSQEWIIQNALSSLGLPPSKKLLFDLQQSLSKLQQSSSSTPYSFTPEELAALSRYSAEEIQLLGGWYQQLQIGGRKWKSLVGLLQEVKQLRNCTLKEVLHSEELQQHLNNSNLQAPVCYRLLKEQLETWRYPTLSDLRKQRQQAVQQLQLPPNTQIQYDPFFEKEAITLTLESVTAAGLQSQLKALLEDWSTEAWDAVFEEE